jgi:hypothetical protein
MKELTMSEFNKLKDGEVFAKTVFYMKNMKNINAL